MLIHSYMMGVEYIKLLKGGGIYYIQIYCILDLSQLFKKDFNFFNFDEITL